MRLIKRIVWSLLPLFILLLSGEVIVRLRYFFYHKHDWNYLTMPFRVQDIQGLDHRFFKQPDDVLFAKKPAAPTAPASGAGPAPAAAQPAAEPQPSSAQMNFKWHRPCQDREVFSAHYNKPMPYTWDANCFRGDSVGTTKPPGEIRIIAVGATLKVNALHIPRREVLVHDDEGREVLEDRCGQPAEESRSPESGDPPLGGALRVHHAGDQDAAPLERHRHVRPECRRCSH